MTLFHSYVPCLRSGLVLVPCLLMAATSADPVAAQPDTLSATVQVEQTGQAAMSMKYWAGPGVVRMDLPRSMSLVWQGGDAPGMLMIQHTERRYMEWGPEQFRVMQQMMERMGNGGGMGQPPANDVTRLRFEVTGRRERIGAWDAFEVRMSGLPAGQDGALWLTNDVDSGLLELLARLGDALSAMQMPMLGGGGEMSRRLLQVEALRQATGLPDGRVVRIVNDEGGRTTTITVTEIGAGPFGADTFQAPEGYEKMSMPALPRP